jgi:hypothetical protein
VRCSEWWRLAGVAGHVPSGETYGMHARKGWPRSPLQLTLAGDLERRRTLGQFDAGRVRFTALRGSEALWLLAEVGERPLFALRGPAFLGGDAKVRKARKQKGEVLRLRLETRAGWQEWGVAVHDGAIPVLALEQTIRPTAPLTLPFLERDLIMLDSDASPGGPGEVLAVQRGVNTGLCYMRLEDAGPFANMLYWQDLTALNPYFAQTGTKPEGVVGGRWPELGFSLPTPERKLEAPKPLEAGKTLSLSRAFIALHEGEETSEVAEAERFMALLGAIYPRVEKPQPELHDWPGRAERTAKDLATAAEARIRHYGHTYIHPYTAAEYPDSMVQLVVLAAVRDWEDWLGKRIPLSRELAQGLEKFFDPKLGTMRRYLPNVGADKNADAVDSWYLYHPLLSLGRLALGGDEQARSLFERSLDYAIKAAHHFDYRWPIMYDVKDFSVITETAGDDRGQTDVGGFYAMVMLLAFELTDDARYLDEARAGLDAARGLRFDLNYQANLTAWGAAAALRLWRITAEQTYLELCQVYLASFMHNAAIWESDIDHARHYRNFLGVTCLQDAPYMAMYECMESFAAFERILIDGAEVLPAGVRLLLDEYCRYALDRAWFYYPDALPEEAIAKKWRNGHIDPKLSFPVEDLYVDGKEAGQVGQEIYGGGAPFIFTSRSFHNFEGAPFRLFCDSFIGTAEQPREGALQLNLAGAPGARARMIAIGNGKPLPKIAVKLAGGEKPKPARRDGMLEFEVPADAALELTW